jgi:hypothetical protein
MPEEPTIQIENAPWWLPHSLVILKEDYTAADESWVQRNMIRFGVQGKGANATPDMQVGKERGVLQVERMVIPGSVVAVQRRNGRVKTVRLPQEAEQLLLTDLTYIIQQIDALNEVMTPQEQEHFLASANGQSKESLEMVK